jgi:hypothetical protein
MHAPGRGGRILGWTAAGGICCASMRLLKVSSKGAVHDRADTGLISWRGAGEVPLAAPLTAAHKLP